MSTRRPLSSHEQTTIPFPGYRSTRHPIARSDRRGFANSTGDICRPASEPPGQEGVERVPRARGLEAIARYGSGGGDKHPGVRRRGSKFAFRSTWKRSPSLMSYSSKSMVRRKYGQSHTSSTKRADEAHPGQRHVARNAREATGTQSRISLSTPSRRPTRQTGLGVSRASKGDLRSRLFLAWSRLQDWEVTEIERPVLGGEDRAQPCSRRQVHPQLTASGLEGVDHLAVPNRRPGQAPNADRKIPGGGLTKGDRQRSDALLGSARAGGKP